MSPFGYIQPFFTRHGIKKMIKRDYIDKDKCALDSSSVTEKRRHGRYPYKPESDFLALDQKAFTGHGNI